MYILVNARHLGDILRRGDGGGAQQLLVLRHESRALPLVLGDFFQYGQTFRGLENLLRRHTFTTRLIFQRISMFAVRFLACRLPMAIRCVVSSAERAMCHSV